MTTSRAQSAREWYDATRARIDAQGFRPAGWLGLRIWPFDGDLRQRGLEPPVEEAPRGGAGGHDCFICDAAAADESAGTSNYVVWRDDLLMLGQPREDTSLPFKAFLMPRRHADLSDLEPREAARMGEVMVHLERAVTDVLDVPRLLLQRWGDGQEHLHWWAMARPTGAAQLRGAFVALWDDVLPARPGRDSRRDLEAVAARLAELAGGIAPGPG
jgi:diadenosine tetraphosphate (Ap4A) HIT family hydrolase